ncbi:MAG: Asp-tRNA(Asn)/Glu-tRNA(Gln) amidotransferase GatCAB subunit C [Alphaproteobacteria bacterium CG_4_10_14_0_8_um_filter_37_21]|nr:MAG: Asp-tRNA(Asn)/Glu-tRNA(Gln) amidotransferase GatCAB subunit C [Alphaproteobacteria bacterium CG_4_10_14_0_8_um_filter_37_21]
MKLTEAEIKRVAQLARINLSQEEVISHGQEITNILTWIEQLNDIDVSHICLTDLVPQETMVERPDTPSTVNLVDSILKNAPKSSFNMFSVPKMVE